MKPGKIELTEPEIKALILHTAGAIQNAMAIGGLAPTHVYDLGERICTLCGEWVKSQSLRVDDSREPK